jgi:C1A family cysteine protease
MSNVPSLSSSKRTYGWIHGVPDFRDFPCSLPLLRKARVPTTVDPRKSQPPVTDQGNLGSCTGHGVIGSLETGNTRNKEPFVQLSALMAYYNARCLEGTVSYDAGATIRGAVKAANKWGTCSEKLWPYKITNYRTQPTVACFTEALHSQALVYERVSQTEAAVKSVLAQGYDIVLGIAVYTSFESTQATKTGIIPMPKSTESLLGGHCMRLIGYSDVKSLGVPSRHFIFQNSWGTGWGTKGFCFLPYSYILSTSLAADLWTIRKVAL